MIHCRSVCSNSLLASSYPDAWIHGQEQGPLPIEHVKSSGSEVERRPHPALNPTLKPI